MAELCVVLPEDMLDRETPVHIATSDGEEDVHVVPSAMHDGQCGFFIPTDAYVSIPLSQRRVCIVETRAPFLPYVALQDQQGDQRVTTAIEHFALEDTPAGPFAQQQAVDECTVGDVRVIAVGEILRRPS